MFQNVLLQSLSRKTCILVTHALHFLPQVDYIYVIADGRLAEQGTYSNLVSQGGEFAKFVAEFGSSKKKGNEQAEELQAGSDVSFKTDEEEKKTMEKIKNAVAGGALMQTEERNRGAIAGKVYKSYLKAGKGQIILPVLFLSLVMFQGTAIVSSYWYIDYLTGET